MANLEMIKKELIEKQTLLKRYEEDLFRVQNLESRISNAWTKGNDAQRRYSSAIDILNANFSGNRATIHLNNMNSILNREQMINQYTGFIIDDVFEAKVYLKTNIEDLKVRIKELNKLLDA